MILYSVLVTILMLMFCGLSIYLTGKLLIEHKTPRLKEGDILIHKGNTFQVKGKWL